MYGISRELAVDCSFDELKNSSDGDKAIHTLV